MNDFTSEINARYPTHEEVEAILKEARIMRARAMRNGAISFWSMLQRVVSGKPVAAKMRHA